MAIELRERAAEKRAFYESELAAIIKAGFYKTRDEIINHALNILFAVKPELRMGMAIELYKEGEITLSRGAEVAGVSFPKFKDELIKRGVEVIVPEVTKVEIKKGVELIKKIRRGEV